MEHLAHGFSKLQQGETIILLGPLLLVLYITGLSIYRLYLSPASVFPGPRLASLTYWYEFYYDVWKGGRYTWKIRELHEKYGPLVRINPYEVHCDDPDFFSVLYTNSFKRKSDKSKWLIRQSWTRNSAFKTVEHDLHKQRRSQLNPFFSKASIRALEPLIAGKVDRLCERLEQLASHGRVVSLTHAFAALTLDIVTHLCFGVSYDTLEDDEFAKDWYESLVASSRGGNLMRHFPWIHTLLPLFPSLVTDSTSAAMQASSRRQKELLAKVSEVMRRYERSRIKGAPQPEHPTIFDGILQADVPAEEKSELRLIDEAHALTGAGTMTTARAMEHTIYFLLRNPDCMRRLADELEAVMPNEFSILSCAVLEKLPYLTAVVHEGLRLSKGVPHRFMRISPDTSYRYGDVVIPRGVPVGMTLMDFLEDPEVYPDPESFVPERWIPFDGPAARRCRDNLVIFGGGSRMCAGMNMAWTELYLTIAVVVRRLGHRLQLRDVDFRRDLMLTEDAFNALASRESKGLRVTLD
ncbi:P450 monooxygenase [Apiospora marii]|uniref:P450 monooxygenase n=1 Tax=Apiospora marii TaxID=335849 RepID=A0ABR1SBZ6_9PEZI